MGRKNKCTEEKKRKKKALITLKPIAKEQNKIVGTGKPCAPTTYMFRSLLGTSSSSLTATRVYLDPVISLCACKSLSTFFTQQFPIIKMNAS